MQLKVLFGRLFPPLLASMIGLAMVALPGPAQAQRVVVAGDGKQVLVAGTPTVPAHPLADTVSVYELVGGAPRLMGSVAAPSSVIGPPGSVALPAHGGFALVTAARKLDPADPSRMIPDDLVSVIDLTRRPYRVSSTVHAGAGASGVAINHAGTLALVANRSEGTVSVFTLSGAALSPAGKLALGDAASGPSQVAFTADGTRALVSRDGDNRISVLNIDGARVTLAPRPLVAGVRPYGLDIPRDGHFGVVANMGGGGTDQDTISLIELAGDPRVVDTVAVGLTPEGVKMSPDGRFVAVALHNGSGSPVGSPYHSEAGILQVWKVEGARLVKITEAPMGRWAQGIVWGRDADLILVEAMGDRELEVFGFDGKALSRRASVMLEAGPAAIGSADPG